MTPTNAPGAGDPGFPERARPGVALEQGAAGDRAPRPLLRRRPGAGQRHLDRALPQVGQRRPRPARGRARSAQPRQGRDRRVACPSTRERAGCASRTERCRAGGADRGRAPLAREAASRGSSYWASTGRRRPSRRPPRSARSSRRSATPGISASWPRARRRTTPPRPGPGSPPPRPRRPSRSTPSDTPAPTDEWSAGTRLSTALGLPAATFAGLPGADRREHAWASALADALWRGTAGYYINDMLDPLAKGDAQVDADLREFVRRNVFACGPLPTLRVAAQPYGVLPVVSSRHYEPGARARGARAPGRDPDARHRVAGHRRACPICAGRGRARTSTPCCWRCCSARPCRGPSASAHSPARSSART